MNLMGAQERYKSTVSLIPEEDNAPALELVRELISSKVTPDNLPELSFRGGVVDDLYSLKFLSCYRRQGNHILTQLSGHTGRRHPEGIVLVGASGVWDPSFERLVEGLRLSDSFRLTELIVTASDRPAGTYQRLLRAMAAYIALSGGTASLGFVHERNEKHKSLLEASGHRLFSSNKFILSHRDDKRLHRYIPAWLNLI